MDTNDSAVSVYTAAETDMNGRKGFSRRPKKKKQYNSTLSQGQFKDRIPLTKEALPAVPTMQSLLRNYVHTYVRTHILCMYVCMYL